MCAATLAESRGSLVTGEQVGIALGIGSSGVWVRPGAGWQGDDALSDMRADVCSRPAGTPCIKYAHQITIVNRSLTGVFNIDLYCTRTGTRYICKGAVHRAMQFIAGLW